MYTFTQIKDRLDQLNYKFFTKGDYNLNIIGVRKNNSNNLFDDDLYLIYKQGNQWKLHTYKITTNPGFKSLENPVNEKGCAILVPSQYCGCYSIGLHKNKYEALVQVGPVSVYRDDNKDRELDTEVGKVETGLFGINIHKAGFNSNLVDNWSAGCQVFKVESEFDEFMRICKISSKLYGNKFTYTLLNEF